MNPVPWFYLAFSLWCAWFSYNAHFPMKAGARRATLSFVAGWLTTELALHHIAWQAIATAVFLALGAAQAWRSASGVMLLKSSLDLLSNNPQSIGNHWKTNTV